jgi:hypothetical protein
MGKYKLMKNLVSVNLKGGLGNYLFQIACVFDYSLKHNKHLILDEKLAHAVHNKISTYKDNVLSKLEFENFKIDDFKYLYCEKNFSYSKIPEIKDNLVLDGYFQSEKYFEHSEIKIKNLFKCDKNLENKLINKFPFVLEEKTCSIHVRRGDYLKLPNFHPIQTIDYYKESIEHFCPETLFLIFSDDIEWCKNAFSKINIKMHFIENNFDYEDLYLMSFCKNNIICNSTFSWWAAWLNNHEGKKVIAPKKWFGPDSPCNTNDLYCKSWIII